MHDIIQRLRCSSDSAIQRYIAWRNLIKDKRSIIKGYYRKWAYRNWKINEVNDKRAEDSLKWFSYQIHKHFELF